jgi:hypothetical protein
MGEQMGTGAGFFERVSGGVRQAAQKAAEEEKKRRAAAQRRVSNKSGGGAGKGKPAKPAGRAKETGKSSGFMGRKLKSKVESLQKEGAARGVKKIRALSDTFKEARQKKEGAEKASSSCSGKIDLCGEKLFEYARRKRPPMQIISLHRG